VPRSPHTLPPAPPPPAHAAARPPPPPPDDGRGVVADDVVPQRSPWLTRTGAVMAAVAAAVGVLALLPSQPVAPQSVASGSSTTAIAPSSDTASAGGSTTSSLAAPTTSLRTPFDRGTSTLPSITPIDDGVIAASECPTGVPTVEIVGTLVRLTNPTTSDVTVTRLDIGGVVSVTSIVVLAGQQVDQQLPATPTSAAIDAWDWTDPAVERSCES
jgi:hypothetical protein